MSDQKNSFSGNVCQHVRLNGERCTQPARRNSDFCRFHAAAMEPLPDAHNLRDQLPILEDEASIQIAIMRVLRYAMKGPLDATRIGSILYGLQLASANLAQKRKLAAALSALERLQPAASEEPTVNVTSREPAS